jgi:hypothetical protein
MTASDLSPIGLPDPLVFALAGIGALSLLLIFLGVLASLLLSHRDEEEQRELAEFRAALKAEADNAISHALGEWSRDDAEAFQVFCAERAARQ